MRTEALALALNAVRTCSLQETLEMLR